MIKARIRQCSCRVENILTLGKLLRLWFCFLLHSVLFYISQTSYPKYKIISAMSSLARPIMGTIFLVYVIVINQMRGLYAIYKSRDTRAKPECQGFMNRVQTVRWFITIIQPASIAYFLGTLLTTISTFSPLIHFSMTHTRLYQKNGSHYRASEVIPLIFQ